MSYSHHFFPLRLGIIIATTIVLSSSVISAEKPAIPAACRDDKLASIQTFIDCYYRVRKAGDGGKGICFDPFWKEYSDLKSCRATAASLKPSDYLYARTVRDLTKICFVSKISESDCSVLNGKLIALKFDVVDDGEDTTSETTTTSTRPTRPPPRPPGGPVQGQPVYKCMIKEDQFLDDEDDCDTYDDCDALSEGKEGCTTHLGETGWCHYQQVCVPKR